MAERTNKAPVNFYLGKLHHGHSSIGMLQVGP